MTTHKEVAPIPVETPRGSRWGSLRRSLRVALRIARVRLRFLIVLVAFFLIASQWELVANLWDRWTGPAPGSLPPDQAVSTGTEYFCPMDPGVVSDWPGKCPVCSMALVRRPRGQAALLPDGVVARMQLTPERIELAGIETTPIEYRRLERCVELVGRVVSMERCRDGRAGRRVHLELAVSEPDLPFVRERDRVALTPAVDPDRTPLDATIEDLRPRPGSRVGAFLASCVADDAAGDWRPGMSVVGRTCLPASQLEPFRSTPAASPTRRGMLLAVPESAVVETGAQRVVYVEREPGMFEGVVVTLGPRCGGYRPVVAGLAAGDRVATAGAFLIDAETRLNPSLAAGYFAASGRRADLASGGRQPPGATSPPASISESPSGWAARTGGLTPPARQDSEDPRIAEALEALSPADRALAVAQRTCPITGKPLGSMGTPVRVTRGGRIAFLCCEGCRTAWEARSERPAAPPHP